MPDGTTYSYTYEHNELRTIRIPGVGNINYPSYTMDRPDSMSSPGDTRSYAYDALARLEDLDSTMLDYAYTYDDVGNILTKTTGHGNYTYGYDDVYRVTDVDNPVLDDEAYTYDGVGNRLTASDVSGDITHNANNDLEVYGDVSYEYDANGNMVSKTSASESWAYTYNVQNRLVQVEEDSLLVAEYGYDPFGRRLWKDVGGTRTYFLYADEGLVAEYDESGEEIRSYGYKPDFIWGTDPLWLKEGGAYYWYQNDHLGTPQKLIDSTGTVVWSATYTAFGKAQIEVETVTNNLCFPGQYYDAETGFHYNWFRYYEPGSGRYTQTDPIGFAGGDINWYAYVWNNVTNVIDPFGLIGIVSNLPEYPSESNCLGGAMTGKNDQFRYPDSSKNKEDSFKGALLKEGWHCFVVPHYKECKCECEQEKILISLFRRTSPKDPWNDPDFPYNPDGHQPNDIHAIRGVSSGCSQIYDEIPHYFPNGGERNVVKQETLDGLFGGKAPLLCCCKGESKNNK